MRLIAWLIPIVILTSTLPLIHADIIRPLSSDGERFVEVLYTFDAPELDGYIGSEEWQTQFTISYFDAIDGESFREIYPETGSDEEFLDQADDIAVTFYMLYDDTYLYFGVNVTDDNIVIDSGSTFWRDDGVELLIDGAHDRDEDQRADDPWPGFEDGTTLLALADGSYFHDYSEGTPYERGFGAEDDWYAVTRSVPSRNYYIVEMRVRLDAISDPSPNSTIGLNIGINDDDTGGDSKTALKWTGNDTGPGENPTFKNESLWGTAYLKPYVKAKLPDRISIDEDTETVISSNLSSGNHPDFTTDANYTWTVPLYDGTEWNNHTSYGKDFIYTFHQPRSYYILNLEIRDPSNITDSTSTYVYVHDVTPPVIVQEDGVALEAVPFDLILNVTDNVGIDRINWSLFDDGWKNISTVTPLFTYTFEHPGDYSLSYVVYDLENNSASGISIIKVVDNAPPVITSGLPDISFNTTETLNLTSPYSFDDTEYGPDSNLIYEWSFDGPYGKYDHQGANLSINIPVPGQYNVTLRVTDAIGLSSEIRFNATVIDDTPPDADFFLPVEIDEGNAFQLNASSSYDNDPDYWNGSVFMWNISLIGKDSWNDSMEGPVAVVTFPFPGTATIELSMTDPSGNSVVLGKTVLVLDATPPKARLWFDPSEADQGEEFYMNITGTLENVGLISVHYTIYRLTLLGPVEIMSTPFFGIRLKNITPENYSKVHGLWIILDQPGEYLINVTVEDSSGMVDNASRTIMIRDSISPVAVINKTIEYVNVMGSVYLSAAESSDEHGPLTYLWSLDDSTKIGDGIELVHGFLEAGEYNITLKVTDSGGNSDTAVCRIVVVEPPDPVQKGETDYTLAYILWSLTGAFILLGFIGLYIWARKKKARAEGTEEE
jgi:hypothetical protein